MSRAPAETAIPASRLFIYYFQGRLGKDNAPIFGKTFIGNWEEGDSTFLFFSEPADDAIDRLLAARPGLKLEDRFCMSYDEWHGEPVHPFRAGRFLIMPPWRRAADKDDVPVILDPGVVFGAGNHPTTRDCLAAIEMVCDRNSVSSSLDLGCGTGVLAIAAARLGSPCNLAVDNNFLAAKTARNNVGLNHLENQVHVVCGSALDFTDTAADLLIANIHYAVMKDIIDRPGFFEKKWVILSGLLRSEAKDIEMRLARNGVTFIEKWVKDGVWHTFLGHLEKRPHAY